MASAIALAPLAGATDGYRIENRSVPSGFEAEAAFLDAIKWPSEPHGAFDAKNAPLWNVEALAHYVPDSGVEFTDVNRRGKNHFSRSAILHSLRKRSGEPFVTFAHLSHIYSVPYKQYSGLAFERVGEITVVRLASWYRLTFRQFKSGVQLVRCDYLQLEGK